MPAIQSLKTTATSILGRFNYKMKYSQKTQQDIIDHFHALYYDSSSVDKTWASTYWFGVPIRKCPMDLWNYQEILFELKPDWLIETGTLLGGSAYYFAMVMDLIGKGRVITIDIDPVEITLSREVKKPERVRPKHDRITYLTGSSTSPEIVDQLKSRIKPGDKVLVNLDSDHSKDHVLGELNIYRQFVNKGSYMIVEDSNVNGHPVYSDHGPGPMEAIDEFLKDNQEFVVDETREKHLFSFNPRGFLKKVK